MTTQTKKKSIKTAVVVTYVIVTLVLIAGWFIPVFGYNEGYEVVDRMMFWYIPALINAFLYPYLGSDVITSGVASDHSLPSFGEFESQVIPGIDIQIPALMALVYLVITVLAIIFLIPVIVGKREKKTSIICSYIIEGAASTALAILFLFSTWETNLVTTFYGYLNLVCVLAAVLVVLFIQSIIEKKSYGVVKMFLFLFSAAATFFGLYAADRFIGMTIGEEPWDNILNAINAEGGLISSVGGLTWVKDIIGGQLRGESAIWNAGNTTATNIINICVLALFAILILNLFIDFCGLMANNKTNKVGAVKPHKGGKIFGIVRYALALVILVCLIVCVLIEDDYNVGVGAYLATIFVLVNLVIDIIRLALVPSQREKAARQEAAAISFSDSTLTGESEERTDFVSETTAASPVLTTTYTEQRLNEVDDHEDVEEEDEEDEEQLAIDSISEEPESSTPIVYTPRPVVYNGPTDEFLDTLTTEEKIEFCKVFIDKTKGKLPAKMPEYEIGGDNENFFPAIFINLGRFRALLSSALLRKIYKYLNSK